MKKFLQFIAVAGSLSILPLSQAASKYGKAEVELGTELSADIKDVEEDDDYFTQAISAIRTFNQALSYAKQGYSNDKKSDEYNRLADRYEDEGDFLKSLNAERLAFQCDSLALYYYNLSYGSFVAADVFFKKGDLKKQLKAVIKNAEKARNGK